MHTHEDVPWRCFRIAKLIRRSGSKGKLLTSDVEDCFNDTHAVRVILREQ